MKKKVIRLTEKDIESLVKKIIKEDVENLDEAGGYDSPELAASHSQNTMEAIYERYKEISEALQHINNMRYDIVDDRLGRETIKFLRGIEPVMRKYGEAWAKSEKRRLGSK